ncbi:putative capsid protein [Dragonfly larvae associated circular virus-10]|uniref:Putative capsid protein n=1 Tax=Dragonfly larvae associated circular virus-10 TaxID=1454022 RepID=W5U2Q8_9VIRU|nr:putative capsid protein [Dragonfly larvae associated circular virus-10]AHH31484.1 putative capsid protein [Dragonfly larvae associated circular virus-10]
MIKAYRVGRERIATTQLSAVTMAPYRNLTRGRYSAKRRYRTRRVTRKRYARTRFSKRRFGHRNRSWAMRKRISNRRRSGTKVLKVVHRWTIDKSFENGIYTDCLSMNASDVNNLPGWAQLTVLYDEWKPGKKYMKSFVPFDKYENEVSDNAELIVRWSAYDPDAKGRKFTAARAVSDMEKMQNSKWKLIKKNQVVSTSYQPMFPTRTGVNLTGVKGVDNPWRDCVASVTSEQCQNGVQQVWKVNTPTTLVTRHYFTQVYYFRGLRIGTQYGAQYEPVTPAFPEVVPPLKKVDRMRTE